MSVVHDNNLKEACKRYLRFLEDNNHASNEEIDKARADMLQAAMLWAQNDAIENPIRKPKKR